MTEHMVVSRNWVKAYLAAFVLFALGTTFSALYLFLWVKDTPLWNDPLILALFLFAGPGLIAIGAVAIAKGRMRAPILEVFEGGLMVRPEAGLVQPAEAVRLQWSDLYRLVDTRGSYGARTLDFETRDGRRLRLNFSLSSVPPKLVMETLISRIEGAGYRVQKRWQFLVFIVRDIWTIEAAR